MKTSIPLQIIENVVCKHFLISKRTLFLKSRKMEIKEPRQIFHYLAEKYSENCLESIGNYEGKMSHATVLHSKKVVNNLMTFEKQFRATVLQLEEQLELWEPNQLLEATKQSILKEQQDIFEATYSNLDIKKGLLIKNKETLDADIFSCHSWSALSELSIEPLTF